MILYLHNRCYLGQPQAFIREAITQGLDDMEDFFLAISRLENPGQRYSQEEVEREVLGYELEG